MKEKVKYCLFIFFITAGISLFPKQVQGQSFAYRTLLSTLYDSDFPTVKPSELTDISSYQILDTREKEEYDVSHLKGAKWVGYDTFDLKSVTGLDKNKPILVYCTVGARSQDIGKKLVGAGFENVANLYGGIIHWSNESMPLFKDGQLSNQVHTYSRTWGIWLEKGEKVF